MKTPWVNLLLFLLLVVQTVTGYFGLTGGRNSGAWVLWLHGVIAYGLVLLLYFKAGVILDAWRRKRKWTARRAGFVVTLVLLLLVLLSGLLWTFDGPIYLGGFSLVSLHIYLAVPLMILMLWHSWHMRFILRVRGATGRRLFLGGLAAVLGGWLLWLTAGRLTAWAGLAGAQRRFTGSYETGSFSDNFPVVSWIGDRPPAVDPAAWSLTVGGLVERPQTIAYAEFMALPLQTLTAVLDCTGGWFAEQHWRGLRVGDLLAAVGVQPEARSVTFESITGYKRRFPLGEATEFLLAVGIVTGEVETGFMPLSPGHGYPVRLVAPGRRGMEWVKWVTAVRLNATGPALQSPLPLQ